MIHIVEKHIKSLTCSDSESIFFALDKFSVDSDLHVKGSLCLTVTTFMTKVNFCLAWVNFLNKIFTTFDTIPAVRDPIDLLL